jgi:hypothetical protein
VLLEAGIPEAAAAAAAAARPRPQPQSLEASGDWAAGFVAAADLRLFSNTPPSSALALSCREQKKVALASEEY